jgi:CRISPR-associated protein Csx17
LLDDVDSWFVGFRRKSAGKNVPARVSFARRRLEQAIFDAALSGSLGPVLLELGEVERALVQSLPFTTKAFLRPVPQLQSAWATAVADSSVEQRLAAALAMRPGMRGRLVPLDKSGRSFGRSDEPGFVFADRSLVDNLHALLLREDVEAMQQDRGPAILAAGSACSLADVARFIDGDVDDVLIERWLRAFVLIDGGMMPRVPMDTVYPPASFAVLSLVHARRLGDEELLRTAGVLARACAGDAEGATRPAIRRLNACGRTLPVVALVEPPSRTRRIAAALAFHLSRTQRRTLESMVLPAVDKTNRTATNSSQEPA